jgi:hypothetical protein
VIRARECRRSSSKQLLAGLQFAASGDQFEAAQAIQVGVEAPAVAAEPGCIAELLLAQFARVGVRQRGQNPSSPALAQFIQSVAE